MTGVKLTIGRLSLIDTYWMFIHSHLFIHSHKGYKCYKGYKSV